MIVPDEHPRWPDGTPVLIGQRFSTGAATRTVAAIVGHPHRHEMPVVIDLFDVERPLQDLTRSDEL